MDITTATQNLDEEWVQEPGHFFWELRIGIFDKIGFARIKDILSSIEVPDGEIFDKRFIEVTWFIPTFMRWQQDAWKMDGKDTSELDEAISFVESRLTTILGVP
jgi:hypothetical protein